MKFKFLKAIFACVVLGISSLANAALIDVTQKIVTGSGLITGVTGVVVGSDIYDVAFIDGTCIEIWNGCLASNFAFTNEDDALNATKALMEQAFQGVFQGADHDTDPDKIFGITRPNHLGNILTPFSVIKETWLHNAMLTNYNEGGSISSIYRQYLINTDTDGNYDSLVFADWTLVELPPTLAPEPSAIALFAVGLFGIGFARKRRSKTL
jgi:hypothetical protein